MKRGPVILLAVLVADVGRLHAGGTIQTLGDVGQVVLPASAVAAVVAHHDSDGGRRFIRAYATAMTAVLVLKATIDEERPDGGRRSFPSGHSASAFAGAAFLQSRYGWLYGAPAYAGAAFVAYSRVHARRHWTVDVVAGGAIGVASNLVFTKRYRKVQVCPMVWGQGAGVVVTW